MMGGKVGWAVSDDSPFQAQSLCVSLGSFSVNINSNPSVTMILSALARSNQV